MENNKNFTEKLQKKENITPNYKYVRKEFIEKTSTLDFKNKIEKLSMESNQITPEEMLQQCTI